MTLTPPLGDEYTQSIDWHVSVTMSFFVSSHIGTGESLQSTDHPKLSSQSFSCTNDGSTGSIILEQMNMDKSSKKHPLRVCMRAMQERFYWTNPGQKQVTQSRKRLSGREKASSRKRLSERPSRHWCIITITITINIIPRSRTNGS